MKSHILFLLFTHLITHNIHALTIMLAPAGTAHAPGRIVHGTFERGLTLQCIEAIKNELHHIPSLHIRINRTSDATPNTFHHANAANRADIDFFVSVHIYEEKNTEHSRILLYRYAHEQDFVTTRTIFESLHTAHINSRKTTTTWGQNMVDALSSTTSHTPYDVSGVFTLPFKPLVGITIPALSIEIGLHHPDDLTQIATILAKALQQTLR